MALSTGSVKQGSSTLTSTLVDSAATVVLASYAVASSTLVKIDAEVLYQRTTNADNGFRWMTAIVYRTTGSASVIADSEISDAQLSWGQGGVAIAATGASVVVTVSATAAPARFVCRVEAIELKQPYLVA